MSQEQKRRKVIFQEKDSAPPVEVEPPFQSAQDESDEISAVDFDELNEEASVETPEAEPIVGREEEPLGGVLVNGWREITTGQQTGKTFLVGSDLDGEGVRAFWRKTRVLDHFKWKLHGKWSDALTRTEVLPEPRYYKEV